MKKLLRALVFWLGWPRWYETGDGTLVVTFTADDGEEDKLACRVDWEGAQFELPLPLLRNHDHARPVGTVVAARPVGRRLRAQALLPPGFRLDAARLAAGGLSVAVGFRALQVEREREHVGGEDHAVYRRVELLEVSLVDVPSPRRL